jgi:phosphatidylglycerophosphate synthase
MWFSRRYFPNILSLSRVPLGFVFLICFSATDVFKFFISLCILGAAFATDFIDGRLARRWRVQTRTGYYLDGLGDKTLYAALLLVIAREDRSQLLIAWSLIVRELILYAMRLVDNNVDTNIGRLKPFSWCYAFSIWAYFLSFLFTMWGKMLGATFPLIYVYYPIFGFAALLFALLHFTRFYSLMTKET